MPRADENEMGADDMTHLSLFSGFGGLDLAAEHAGIRTVGQCEWSDYPTQVLEKHWPDVPRWRDIRTLTGGDFYERTGLRTVDLISGGFPCQPFSCAGQRKGKDDDRYLWPEMLRVISEIRPTWVVGENVAGLLSMGEPLGGFKVESRTIARLPDQDMYDAVLTRQERMYIVQILEELSAIGYDVQTFCIPACGVGANHQRYRIAIVGYSKHDGSSAAEVARGAGAASNDRAEGSEEGVEPARAGQSGDCQRVERDVSDTDCQSTQARRTERYRRIRQAAVNDGCDDGSPLIRDTERSGREGVDRRRSGSELEVGCSYVPDPASKRCGEARNGGKRSEEWSAGLCYVENTDHSGCSESGDVRKQSRRTESISDGKDMADTNDERLEVTRLEPRIATESTEIRTEHGCRRSTKPRMGRRVDGLPAELGRCGRERGDEWFLLWQQAWADGSWEADIPRVAVGWVPSKRAAMLTGFGNAVVPQAWYPVFKAIAEVERGGAV